MTLTLPSSTADPVLTPRAGDAVVLTEVQQARRERRLTAAALIVGLVAVTTATSAVMTLGVL